MGTKSDVTTCSRWLSMEKTKMLSNEVLISRRRYRFGRPGEAGPTSVLSKRISYWGGTSSVGV